MPYCHHIALIYAFMPQDVYSDFHFLPLPSPLSDKNLHLQHFFTCIEIIFTHILVSPWYAIEV